jgi:DNA-dependent RNA polymerase auxiliary subunit epsilon
MNFEIDGFSKETTLVADDKSGIIRDTISVDIHWTYDLIERDKSINLVFFAKSEVQYKTDVQSEFLKENFRCEFIDDLDYEKETGEFSVQEVEVIIDEKLINIYI